MDTCEISTGQFALTKLVKRCTRKLLQKNFDKKAEEYSKSYAMKLINKVVDFNNYNDLPKPDLSNFTDHRFETVFFIK